MKPHQIQVGGQVAWVHDAHAAGGVFHTFDGLKCAGPADKPRKVHVWLPPGYGDSGRRHPLVVMNDGPAVFFAADLSGQTWNAQRAATDLAAKGEILAPIVVGVCTLNRAYEYLHLPSSIPELNGGGVRGYSAYLAEHLVSFIDQNYRTTADRGARVVAGSSNGGLAAFYSATMFPGVFGSAICMSPSFWANHMGSIAKSALMVAARPTLKDRERRPRFWIDWGLVRSGGLHNFLIERWATWRARDMADVLVNEFGYEDGKDLFWDEDEEGSHTEGSWARRLPNALRALLGAGYTPEFADRKYDCIRGMVGYLPGQHRSIVQKIGM